MAAPNMNTAQGLAAALALAVALGIEDAEHKRKKRTGRAIVDHIGGSKGLHYRNGHIAFLRNSYIAGYWTLTVNHEETMRKLKKEFEDLK